MEQLLEISRSVIDTYGYLGVFLLTTLEQFIFPIPADFFAAMGTANGLPLLNVLALVLLGAIAGSAIGYLLGKYLGHPAAQWLFGKRNVDKGEAFIDKWGIWGVILAGLTPLPFKLVTWSAGIFEMPFKRYMLGVAIGRMPRYILTAYAGTWLYESKFYATTDMSAVILGALQGLTEFLPVSSSGHLVVMEHFLKLPIDASQMVTFDIFLHGGSLIAILAYFWKDWLEVLRELWQMLKKRHLNTSGLAFRLAAGTIPAIIIGLALGGAISDSLRTLHSVAFFFILIGSTYFYASWKGKGNHDEKINLKKAIIIGCAQAAALIPGVSRAGATISAGVVMGITREAAAKFSFMLGGIAILAANVYSLLTLNGAILPNLKFIVIGTTTSFLTSLIAIYLLLRFLQKHTMTAFGIYLLMAGTIILSFL
ncbi:MAG: VTT domain-containing protein [Candidatus Peregrinibacteria bacterium]|nr:VTT domain-containing protein [Candidatus Peregrinibacteria bacterium]